MGAGRILTASEQMFLHKNWKRRADVKQSRRQLWSRRSGGKDAHLPVQHGCRHFGISGPYWKKCCLGLHIKHTATCNHKEISWCFKKIYDFVLGHLHSHPGCMWLVACGLDTPACGFCYISPLCTTWELYAFSHITETLFLRAFIISKSEEKHQSLGRLLYC